MPPDAKQEFEQYPRPGQPDPGTANPPPTPEAEPSHPQPLSTLIASARRLTQADVAKAGRARRKKSASRDWQDTARDMYRSVGEYQFIVDTISGKVGAAKLFVGKISHEDPSNDPQLVDDQPDVVAVLNSLGGTYAGRSQLLTRLAVNLMVVGDGWICGIPEHLIDPDGHPAPEEGSSIPLESLDWRFMSIKEVTVTEAKVKLKVDNLSDPIECSPDQVYLIRVWDPDPFEWWEAAASSRANLPVLKELVGLTMHISAQVDSRLAGAGVFLVPQSAQQALQAAAGVDESSGSDQFTEALIEAMLTPITDRGSASAVVPLVITAPDESIALFRHISFAGELDDEARELREEAIRRLALGMDAPPEVLMGTSGANHWGCVDPDTEILTRRGWIRHDGLEAGETVLTLNHETGRAEWQPVETVHRWDVADAPLLRLDSFGHHSWTTLDHNWPVIGPDGERDWLTSEELEPGVRIVTAAAGAPPLEPTHSDALVELAAWYAMGGYASRTVGNAKIRIIQSHVRNPEGVDRIRAALIAEYGPDGFHEVLEGSLGSHTGRVTGFHVKRDNRRPFADTVLVPGSERADRLVSPEFIAELTQEQLELFIDASAAANTRHDRTVDTVDAWLGNPAQLEAFALAGTLAGYSVSWTAPAPNPGGSPGDWCVSLSRQETVEPLAGEVSFEAYTGVVWCPQVPNRTWLARRGRHVFFTGNSWMVSADVISSHVEPKLALICDALTTQYLWPVLSEQEVEDYKQYVIWYDVQHLITRPNRSQDALALNERKIISDVATRRELGFDEDDAPVEEDPVAATILAMAQANPGMLRSPALPQMVRALKAIVAGDWDALAKQTEEPPEPAAAPGPAAAAEEAPAGEVPAVAPVGPNGAQPAAVPAEPDGPSGGAPRLPTSTALPVQGIQRAPVG